MYEFSSLKNGLEVVVEKIPYVRTVSVGLWVGNGSRNESSYNNGISHFIEHMMFKGTKNRSAKAIAEAVEDVGGMLNAFTGKEATCFYIKVLDTHLSLSLDILSDMLFNSLFREEDLQKEKSVIMEEINMTEDSPFDLLLDLQSEAAFGEDPLSRPILGTSSSVKSFSKEMVEAYLRENYTPENSVISIAGNVDMKTTLNLVEEYFGEWKGNSKIKEYNIPIILKNSHKYKEKKLEQLHMSFCLQGLEMGDDSLYALFCLNNIFGGGSSSMLFQSLREDLGLCYTIYSYLSSYKNIGTLNIYAALNSSYAKVATENIIKQLNCFINTSIDDTLLMKVKEQLKGEFILGLENTSSRMFNNGKNILFFKKLITPEEIMKKIDRVQKEIIYETLNKTFEGGILNTAMVGEAKEYNNLIKYIEGEDYAYKNKKSFRV